jgi:hypothetical protein
MYSPFCPLFNMQVWSLIRSWCATDFPIPCASFASIEEMVGLREEEGAQDTQVRFCHLCYSGTLEGLKGEKLKNFRSSAALGGGGFHSIKEDMSLCRSAAPATAA